MRILHTAVTCGALLCGAALLPAQQATDGGDGRARTAAASAGLDRLTQARAARAITAPTIDGRPGDPAWDDAPVIDQFLEYEPVTGAEPRFRTEVRVLYDDRYLYVLGRMYDPAPDSIIALLSRRDVRTESEQLKLVIDSYHDRRTAFQFILNPAGVKRDFFVYNDNVEDATWDAVWDGHASVDSLGWVAEFRIPFSQMRFADLDEHTFGLMIVRDVARTRQRISWPLYRRDVQGYVSQSGEISGIERIPQPRRLEVVPYAVTKNTTRPDGPGRWTHPQEQAVGADLKWGLTSNLTVDATINPDFGQVEADPATLNLSAFELFFEERRPFFLEGAGIFNFRTACGDIDTGCTGLFYSRRVGRSPQLGGLYFDDANPTSSRILGATKLSGRLANGLNIGVLNALTARELGSADRTIEPQTNYAVVRLLKDLREGQSGLGAMLTATNRALDGDTRDFLRSEAYTGGIDLRHRFMDRNYELHAYVAGSLVKGSPEAIAATQRDGVHRYQRRDDGVSYDPTRTSLAGDAQRITLSKFGGGRTRFQTVYERFSPGFETNDLGFQDRADRQMFRNWFSLQFQRPTRYYRRLNSNFNTFSSWSAEGLLTGASVNTNHHLELPNTQWLHTSWNYSFAGTFDDRGARGGPAYRREARLNYMVGWEGDRRPWYTPTFFVGGWTGDRGRTSGQWFEPGFQFRVSSRFSASLFAYGEHGINAAQWFNNYGDVAVDTAHVTFAKLDQWTVSISTRLNFTATPDLSFQLFARPFTSVGDFSEWKELADPRARDFDQRFAPYGGNADPGGFNSKALNLNAVMRWEYRPGSVLFLVWQQGRSGPASGTHDFEFGRDVMGVFDLHPDNTFLVKASYWFNP
jgi:hypothetical protein